MNRLSSLAAGIAAFVVVAGVGAKTEDKGPHLRYATTFASGVEEARARNCLLYVTFHKDH